MRKPSKQLVMGVMSLVALGGCQSGVSQSASAIAMPANSATPIIAQYQPPAYPAPVAPQPQQVEAFNAAQEEVRNESGTNAYNTSALSGDIIRLQERIERIERAMLRLDRRMQLVERKELNRMQGVDEISAGEGSENLQAANAINIPSAPEYKQGFTAVSMPITSALQAARPESKGGETSSSYMMAKNTSRLPSLADPRTEAKENQRAVADIAIWTIRYDADKVWPDRAQLPESRNVVAALQENKHTSLYARGNKPSSVEFRDRIKAVSRYLSKVTNVESVPIAAMSAPHLDDNTIEIFAAP